MGPTPTERVTAAVAQRAELEPKPDAFPLGAEPAIPYLHFELRMGQDCAQPAIAPLLLAAARHRAHGERLGRAQAGKVLEQVLADVAKQASPADLDVLRKVREQVAAEVGRRFGQDVVCGEES